MLQTVLLLLAGITGHPAAPAWRIHVAPSQSNDTFHFAVPPAWRIDDRGRTISVQPADAALAVTLTSYPDAAGSLDETVLAMFGEHGADAPVPTRESRINTNWRGVSLESRSRMPGDDEDTARYLNCMRSGVAAYPTVCVSASARAGVFDANREAIVRIANSVRFRPVS